MGPRAVLILLLLARIKTVFLSPLACEPVTTPTELSQLPLNAQCVFMNEMLSAIRTNKCKCVNSLCEWHCLYVTPRSIAAIYSPLVK
jgi:hypothetical protein